MILWNYKFTRISHDSLLSSSHFAVETKDWKKWKLPLLYDDLSEKQKTHIKGWMILTKVLSIFFLPIILLLYKNYKLLAVWVILFFLVDIIYFIWWTIWVDESLLEAIWTIWWIMSSLWLILSVIYFLMNGNKDSYNAGAYHVLKIAYENR